MAVHDDDKPVKIPKKFRVSINPTDADGYKRLLANDEQQKELGQLVNSPFASTTPLGVQRSKAVITIKALSEAGNFEGDNLEILAECYATIGRFDIAATISVVQPQYYLKVWEAVFRDDEAWCEHSANHRFIKAYVYSVRDEAEEGLLACNICGWLNVRRRPTPDLRQAKTARDVHRGQTSGMSINDALQYHEQKVRKA